MRRVGIDIGIVAPHRAVVYDDAQAVGRAFKVEKTRAGFDDLVRRATVGTEGPIEFVMDPSGLGWLPLAADLRRQGHRVYAPKPQKTSALRKFYSRHAKTDSEDARALAMIRQVDPAGVHPLRVPTANQTMLRMSVKQRARWVAEAARAKQRTQAWLMMGSPHLMAAFGGDVSGQIATAFLRRYVDPFLVRTLGKAELHQFWARHAVHPLNDTQCDAVFEACEKTCAMFEPLRAAGQLPFDYEVLQTLVTQELEHIEFLERQTKATELSIARLYQVEDPERTLEREVPGVGPAIAPTIEAFVGDVERFSNYKQFAASCGVVSRTRQSGVSEGSPRQRITKSGPPLLRQYLFLAAEIARRLDPELAAAYQRAIDHKKHHYAAIVALGHKLARKIYAVLRLRAAARRSRAEGRPEPVVAYRLIDPTTGEVLTRKEARDFVSVHFPSKAVRERTAKKAAEATSSKEGSSEDAAMRSGSAPPMLQIAPEGAPSKVVSKLSTEPTVSSAAPFCGKRGDNPVDKTWVTRLQEIVDGARRRLDPT